MLAYRQNSGYVTMHVSAALHQTAQRRETRNDHMLWDLLNPPGVCTAISTLKGLRSKRMHTDVTAGPWPQRKSVCVKPRALVTSWRRSWPIGHFQHCRPYRSVCTLCRLVHLLHSRQQDVTASSQCRCELAQQSRTVFRIVWYWW